MLKDFDSQQCSSQHNAHSFLKIVVSNSVVAEPQRIPQKKLGTMATQPNTRTGFTSEIRELSPSKYVLVASDNFNYLGCEITLEIEDYEDGADSRAAVVNHFSPISTRKLEQFTALVTSITDLIVAEFQMKVLEQLLSFCKTHNAPNLIIRIEEREDDPFWIYQKLTAYRDKIPAINGTLIQLTMHATSQTFGRWRGLMSNLGKELCRSLWAHQRTSPAANLYLRSRSLISREASLYSQVV